MEDFVAHKLEWTYKKEDDGYVLYKSTNGEWEIDNCIEKPPLVDLKDWEGWDLYLIDGKSREWIGGFKSPTKAKKEAEDIVSRDSHG